MVNNRRVYVWFNKFMKSAQRNVVQIHIDRPSLLATSTRGDSPPPQEPKIDRVFAATGRVSELLVVRPKC